MQIAVCFQMEAYLRDLNLRLVRSLNGEPKWHGTYVIQMVSGGKGNQTLLIHCEMSRVKAIWSLWNNSYTDIYSSTSSVSSSSLCLSVNEKCIAVPSHS